MTRALRYIGALTAMLLSLPAGITAGAQDSGPTTRSLYYLGPDGDGITQVFQYVLGGDDEPRQITSADSDVRAYGASHDGLSVAYVAGDQLWLQPIDAESAEALAPVTDIHFASGPVFDPDDAYIAYANDGVWLFDLTARETVQLLKDVPLDANGSNMPDFRLYEPAQFVRDADGAVSGLIVNVGVWEWQTPGIYDLEAGELTLLEGQVHTRALPLSSGKLLLYGNGGVAGEMSLSLVDGIESFDDRRVIVDFADVSSFTLFAEKAVEIQPDTVRVVGSALIPPGDSHTAFVFDVSLTDNTVSDPILLTLGEDPSVNVVAGAISPDGALMAVYTNATYTPTGAISGTLSLIDLTTGEIIESGLPDEVSTLAWQS